MLSVRTSSVVSGKDVKPMESLQVVAKETGVNVEFAESAVSRKYLATCMQVCRVYLLVICVLYPLDRESN